MLRHNKKGSAVDVIFVAVVLLVFAMVTLLGFTITSKFDDKIQDIAFIPQEAKDSTDTLKGHYTGIMDNVILLLLGVLVISSFILAYLVKLHPIFLPFYILVFFFIVVFAGVLSNIYQEMAESPQLSPYADQLTFTTQLLYFLPFVVAIIGILVMVATYKLGDSMGG